jgi:threonine dehydrogenase-like Zn-dependent dehydrogenase
VSVEQTPLQAIAGDVGGFDLVLEAAGDAQGMLDILGLLDRNGVACLLGLDGRPQHVSIDGRVVGVDAVLKNLALFGSVNAHPDDWREAVRLLDEARGRWPGALDAMVDLRVQPGEFERAFNHRGVKATLRFGD